MKKAILISVIVSLFVCLFAFSVGAEGPKDLFSDVTILDNINKTTTFGYGETDFSRVVMLDPISGNYITYPTYYIFDKRDHNTEGNQPTPNFSYLNNATNRTGTEGEFKINHIVCLELPEAFTAVSPAHSQSHLMTSLQYIKLSKTVKLIHSSAFKSNSVLSLIEFEENTEEGARLEILPYAFDNCDALVKVDFPVQLKVLGERSFGDNLLLEEVNFAAGTDFTLYNADGTIKNNTLYAVFINDPALKSLVFPKGITSTGSLACGSCTSLEYVYIPSTCKAFEDEAFLNCSNLETIEFEEGAQLQTIGKKAISESKKITSLVFPNTFLTTSGEAPIRNLQNLTYLNFGASFVGFTGYASMYSTNNANLVIVMPSTFDMQYKDQLPSNAVILYTGSKDQASGFGYGTIQSYDEWIKEGSPKGKRIVYGYNICTAFYGGEHDYTTEGSFENDCVLKCGRCGLKTEKKNPNHDLKTVITYNNGFINNGFKVIDCKNSECGYHAEYTSNALISFVGISSSEKDFGICLGYSIDQAAVNEYINAGNTFKFGVALYIPQENEESIEVIDNSLNAINPLRTIMAQIDNSYCAFDFVVRGFENHQNMNFVMTAFVYDGNEVDYINASIGENSVITVSQDGYATLITYKSISSL